MFDLKYMIKLSYNILVEYIREMFAYAKVESRRGWNDKSDGRSLS